jgi:hypothetical protein
MVRPKGIVSLTHCFRKIRGGSQPILASASDGHVYVVKFSNNPQGHSVLFNEAMGTELYDACGLPVPPWTPLLMTAQFVDQNPECWIEAEEGPRRPEPGMSFGSRFLGEDGNHLHQFLPPDYFRDIPNRDDFWFAWAIDICAGRSANRQAVFLRQGDDRLKAFFVAHGQTFAGPNADSARNFHTPAYNDMRIYDQISASSKAKFARIACNLNVERLQGMIRSIPEAWQSVVAIDAFDACLGLLTRAGTILSILNTITCFCPAKAHYGFFEPKRDALPPAAILRHGIPCGSARPIVS